MCCGLMLYDRELIWLIRLILVVKDFARLIKWSLKLRCLSSCIPSRVGLVHLFICTSLFE